MNTRPYEIHERQADGSWEIVSTWETPDQADNDILWLQSIQFLIDSGHCLFH